VPVLLLPSGHAAPVAAGFPTVTVEIMFTAAGWTDVTQYVEMAGGGQITITRGSSQVESPAIRYDAGTCTIPFINTDRRFDPTNLSGPYVAGGKTQVLPRVQIRVSATYASVTYRLFTGFVDNWNLSWTPPFDAIATVTCTDGFEVLGNQARTPNTSNFGGGEDSGARVTRILDDCGWSAPNRSITPGDSTVQPTYLGAPTVGIVPLVTSNTGGTTPAVNVAPKISTSSPLDELQLTGETEMGELYVNGNGVLVFRHRHGLFEDARSVTPQAVFGDDPAPATTELDYADVTIDYGKTTLWNGAAIANAGGLVQQAADATSQQNPPAGYGPRVYDQESLIADSDFQALAYAQWIVATSKNAQQKFATMTIDPRADTANLFPQVLGREIGDRITVKRRPPGGGTVTRDVFIRGVSHTFNDSAWSTGWVFQDATSLPQPFILDDAVNGVLNQDPLGF
jgi:hypothetical protein